MSVGHLEECRTSMPHAIHGTGSQRVLIWVLRALHRRNWRPGLRSPLSQHGLGILHLPRSAIVQLAVTKATGQAVPCIDRPLIAAPELRSAQVPAVPIRTARQTLDLRVLDDVGKYPGQASPTPLDRFAVDPLAHRYRLYTRPWTSR
ncbi:MAG TPA: hypothetical protein DCE39_07800 [Planctomycetaceae bacterium]|nr:hypothetical protein [Planctomycetaceae bacterium]